MRRKKGLVLLALLALVAFTITATIGGSASASGGNAVAAKKKCKKKKKNHAASAKRKRCKPRKNVPQKSVVRATLNWSNGGASDVDMDLFVFDTSGRQAGNGTDAIPASVLSPDITGPSGTETFTDLNGNTPQTLSFGVCYMVGGSVHTDYTITYITADGVTHTETRAGDGSTPGTKQSLGSEAHVNYPGGAPIPDNYCPGTPLVP
jgi:hypothetical protein